jgi:hypothetical protein
MERSTGIGFLGFRSVRKRQLPHKQDFRWRNSIISVNTAKKLRNNQIVTTINEAASDIINQFEGANV